MIFFISKGGDAEFILQAEDQFLDIAFVQAQGLQAVIVVERACVAKEGGDKVVYGFAHQ
ncbi:hypothetical protein D3C86_1942580 [compost metagenome]